MQVVLCKAISKNYGDIRALKGVDLSVDEGELFGLLGVNGAGKTTLIKILCGLTKPTEGEAWVYGNSILTQLPLVKEVVDVSPQETSVAPNLTAKENLHFFASLYYREKGEQAEAVRKIVETFSLEEVLSQKAKTLSGGWQRRLSIACSLVSNPKVLFLDEPTLGLDVLARRELWKIIQKIKSQTTIVLTSHYLEEIEALCDRVAIMVKGRIIALGTCEEIKALSGKDNFEDAFVELVTREEQV
ncbi:MAG: ABC transporter ATP-binding protein [Candidatus Coproplasma sp.]